MDKWKSLLLLLAITACSKVKSVGDVSTDADADCDGVCVVEIANDITETADLSQPVSPSSATTETAVLTTLKEIKEELKKFNEPVED